MNRVSENRIKRNHQRGQSIVEISLITPLLLIALYIPADFGVAFFVGNLTQTAAREGARIGSGLQKTKDLNYDSTQGKIVKNEVLSRMPAFLSAQKVTVKFFTGTSCMEFLQVTAEGQYNFFLYQLMRLFGASAPDSMSISRTTQIRYNYQPYTNTDYCTGSTTL
jgi:hypothetical protein